MTSSPTQATPLPEQNKQPDAKLGNVLTDAEKKAEAEKAQPPGSSNTKS